MKGIFGARKYPVRLAKRIGIKYVKPVSVASKIVVLIGVLVTQTLIAAIHATTARERSVKGKSR